MVHCVRANKFVDICQWNFLSQANVVAFGFPDELFAVQYPAPGNTALAQETVELLHSANIELDHDWGLDHGTWTVVRHMCPGADMPVLPLSIDYTKGPQYHYDLAKRIVCTKK